MNTSAQIHSELARLREHEIRAEAERRRQTSTTPARRFVRRSGTDVEPLSGHGSRLAPVGARRGEATSPECCAS